MNAMPSSERPERLLTTREVAELLGLSPEAVLRRVRRGELPCFRLSSKVLRFRESEIVDVLEAMREGPEPFPRAGLQLVDENEEEG